MNPILGRTRELAALRHLYIDQGTEDPMDEPDNSSTQFADLRTHYVMLAIEAELLSAEANSPYIRDACLRLSSFWTAQAAALQNHGDLTQSFHAPTRAEMQPPRRQV